MNYLYAIESLYIGTLRILLILLHDFPEFLASYYVTLCSIFPINFIQLRNLVLSAFPRNIKLPDPFMSDVKIDLLPEIKIVPKILTNISFLLFKNRLKFLLDEYFHKKDYNLLFQIKDKLLLPKNKIYQSFIKYDVDIINSLTLYVGTYICKAKVNNLFKFNNNCDPINLTKYSDDSTDDNTAILQELILENEQDNLNKGKKKNNKKCNSRTISKKEQSKLKNEKNNLSKKYVELMKDEYNEPNQANEEEPKTSTKLNSNINGSIESRKEKNKSVIVVKNNLSYTLFLFLSKELDMEGRYLLLSNIVNHIRYPNSHTHYFSCLILFIFSQSNDIIIQEQIIRVLLERILAHRPHPWGLLITFIELIKNTK